LNRRSCSGDHMRAERTSVSKRSHFRIAVADSLP
jgi:hypothetical protein